jgi:multiple sugar transport system permease protein
MTISPYRIRAIVLRFLLYVFLCAAVLLILFPILWTLSTSLKAEEVIFLYPPKWIPDEPTLASYRFILSKTDFPRFFFNSFIVSVTTIMVVVTIGTMSAYRFARARFPGRNLIMFLFLATMMIPGLANLIPLYIIIRKMGLMDTRAALVMLYTSGNLPLVVWLMKGFIESIPKELDESARLDGCTTFQIFAKVIVPVVKPGLSAAGIIVFINTWNEFIAALTFIQSPEKRMLQVGIRLLSGYYTVQWTNIMATCMLGSIPPIILFLFFQRSLIAGLTRGAIKG